MATRVYGLREQFACPHQGHTVCMRVYLRGLCGACGVSVERAGSVWSGVGMWMRAVVCMRPCKRESVHHTHPG